MITVHPNENGPITVTEGSDVVLRCRAAGDGTLNYQWRRVSGSLPGNARGRKTSTLSIRNITVNDRGQYYCEVDNGGDSVSSMRVQVAVKRKLQIINCSYYVKFITYRETLHY